MRDLDGLVAIGAIHTLGGHKRRAGYRADRLEHARVAHTGGMNQTRQLPGPRGRLRRAGYALHGSEGYAGSAAEPRAYGNPVPELVLGPVLRYVGIDAATVWVEADAPCQVEVLGHRERTFTVDGHHYALVCIGDLAPGQVIPYDVRLDGRRVWPPPDHPFPQPAIRTLDGRGAFRVAFGSCRVALPHWPPYTLAKDEHPDGREFDALFTLARELLGRPREDWPDLLLMRGDQVIRWLLSTIPTAMVLDDHDMADDWNISGSWKEEMNRRQWWRGRLVGGLMSSSGTRSTTRCAGRATAAPPCASSWSGSTRTAKARSGASSATSAARGWSSSTIARAGASRRATARSSTTTNGTGS